MIIDAVSSLLVLVLVVTGRHDGRAAALREATVAGELFALIPFGDDAQRRLATLNLPAAEAVAVIAVRAVVVVVILDVHGKVLHGRTVSCGPNVSGGFHVIHTGAADPPADGLVRLSLQRLQEGLLHLPHPSPEPLARRPAAGQDFGVFRHVVVGVVPLVPNVSLPDEAEPAPELLLLGARVRLATGLHPLRPGLKVSHHEVLLHLLAPAPCFRDDPTAGLLGRAGVPLPRGGGRGRTRGRGRYLDVGLVGVLTVGAELRNWVGGELGKTLVVVVRVTPFNVLGDVNADVNCADELAHVHAARKARGLAGC